MTLNEYRDEIDRLILSGTDETITNGSAAHAAIIIERMFKHAQHSMRILTRRLDPKIFADPEVIDHARVFLSDPSNTVHVLVENFEDRYVDDHMFVTAFRHLPNVKIETLPAPLSSRIESNFALMDDRGVRFEEDKNRPIASASFNDQKYAEAIKLFFEAIANVAEPISAFAIRDAASKTAQAT